MKLKKTPEQFAAEQAARRAGTKLMGKQVRESIKAELREMRRERDEKKKAAQAESKK